MPYPNEHVLRMQDPDKFDSYGRTKGGKLFGDALEVPATIGVLWGHPKGGPAKAAVPQALRFPKAKWTEEEEKKWVKDNSVKTVSFEPANGDEKEEAERILFAKGFRNCYQSWLTEGGAGSGNFGHAGRPGEVGGSGESESGAASGGSYDKQTRAAGEKARVGITNYRGATAKSPAVSSAEVTKHPLIEGLSSVVPQHTA